MKRIFSYSLILISCTAGCNIFKEWKNDQIPSEIRSQIHNLNHQIINGIIENNPGEILNVCSDSMKEIISAPLETIIQKVGNKFSKKKYKILDDFYIKISKRNSPVNVMSGMSGNHDYVYSYKALKKETFVSVGYFEDTSNETSLVLRYGKYNNEWKLNRMDIGTLSIMQKDAFDWYEHAKKEFQNGFYIDAGDDIILAKETLKPGGLQWHYQKEKEILKFGQKIMTKVNSMYSFPITIDYVSTKPKIFRLYPSRIQNGYFPMIEYTTSIKINDTTKLSRECDEINNNIGELFHGIKKNNGIIIYMVFNAIPNGSNPVQSYRFIKHNKK